MKIQRQLLKLGQVRHSEEDEQALNPILEWYCRQKGDQLEQTKRQHTVVTIYCRKKNQGVEGRDCCFDMGEGRCFAAMSHLSRPKVAAQPQVKVVQMISPSPRVSVSAPEATFASLETTTVVPHPAKDLRGATVTGSQQEMNKGAETADLDQWR
eukprot:TRINITY_DN1805_c0_g2_i1.p2 TRINITY_DN1805_c0_g2~~TRINITY_DN1805_c0_g2_i1.p2  ORF type:complete len:154 (-),score=19.98 TRINITY_DN1805_c0_g2_i1:118-579(-)